MNQRRTPLCCVLAVGAYLLSLAVARGQIVERRPTPLWMEGAARYEIGFEHREPLLMAILLVVSDRDVVVEVNGEIVGAANDPTKATSHEITRRLRAGGNRVAVLSKDGDPVRAAALLELNGDLSTSRWIGTGPRWTAPGGNISLGGAVDADPTANPFDPARVADAYSSWKLARPGEQSSATDPAGFTMPPGFRVELVRSAVANEGSWVAMAFDPEGRITIAKEKRGLLRLGPDGGTELIEDSLLECRGLLYTAGCLYAHANNSKVLMRLRDADGDGVFEEKTELLRTEGGVGHGRNHVRLGPDGNLWIALGNNVRLTDRIAPSSPLRHFADDQVLPNPWSASMFDGDVELPAGHILRMSPGGELVELVTGGMRNPLDIAFNREGEPFTFDADMEWDIRTPWYMPNRVLHLVAGADFGWRRGTGRFPARHVDTLPSVADIGLGSPTAVFFGYGGRMPERYAEALFICDWAYGRILAVRLRPEGASYAGEVETFISGRPLNVTDGCIGPDGDLWFLTGGRGTQSGLYRVSYEGESAKAGMSANGDAGPLRDLRRRLEEWHRGIPSGRTPEALALILPNLAHEDRFIRHAARVALERIPADRWQQDLLEQEDGWPVLLGALALARTAEEEAAPVIFDRLLRMRWESLDAERRFAVLRVLAVTIARMGDPDGTRRGKLLAWLEPHFPAGDPAMSEDLCLLLIRLKSSVVLERTLALLRKAETPEELLFYPLHLRYLTSGWNLESRRVVFGALNRAGEFGGGGRNHIKAIQDLRAEYAATLSPDEAGQLAGLIRLAKPAVPAPMKAAAKVKEWKLEDLLPSLQQVDRGRSFDKGREATLVTGCAACHRVSPDPAFPAGLLGPDLVQVSARFGRRDLLEHILNPSKVVEEKYRVVVITRTDGAQVVGTVESENDESVILKPNPFSPETIGIGKSQIAKREVSALSQMPTGLLDSLEAGQILDLLAFLEANGDPEHRSFEP